MQLSLTLHLPPRLALPQILFPNTVHRQHVPLLPIAQSPFHQPPKQLPSPLRQRTNFRRTNSVQLSMC
ncbi:hypothetical protein BDV98DRAFT_574204 [Pterulicium gracile]|uniref:Uncharacterized protein n=1 Tax=Pterulicium gracile TaxID=1884261 RepID=A0A5C3Q7I4_9AGAR|nr:hypothetical protein BDV98DRAFT_574204 [Pterula gracilis]